MELAVEEKLYCGTGFSNEAQFKGKQPALKSHYFVI